MNWETLQQLIRIMAYAAGSYFLGDAAASGETYQAAVGGLVSIGAFVWWAVKERQKKSA
jgi:hypothetical protein